MKTILLTAPIGLLMLASTAQAQANPLLGHWQIVAASPAPWVAPETISTMIKETGVRRLLQQRVTFAARDVTSRDTLLACKGARYAPVNMPPAGLFQGNLPEPKADAAKALGFAAGDIASVDVTCANGVFSYHFRDKDTALFALDNVIYTLKRR